MSTFLSIEKCPNGVEFPILNSMVGSFQLIKGSIAVGPVVVWDCIGLTKVTAFGDGVKLLGWEGFQIRNEVQVHNELSNNGKKHNSRRTTADTVYDAWVKNGTIQRRSVVYESRSEGWLALGFESCLYRIERRSETIVNDGQLIYLRGR
ncbi:MAG: hypothetical protein WCT01_01535 [Candidatus Shapirobacteria bacterium]